MTNDEDALEDGGRIAGDGFCKELGTISGWIGAVVGEDCVCGLSSGGFVQAGTAGGEASRWLSSNFAKRIVCMAWLGVLNSEESFVDEFDDSTLTPSRWNDRAAGSFPDELDEIGCVRFCVVD